VSTLKQLENRLGYRFEDQDLLTRALTHRSQGTKNYERLEFLGDAILGVVIAETLYHKFDVADEGQLSRLRSRIVRKETLAEVARELNLGEHLLLGLGELKSGGFNRDSILSDALEAIMGGIYLESGHGVVANLIETWFGQKIDALSLSQTQKDPKTRLQEFLQGKALPLPEYRVIDVQGKSHDQIFTVQCCGEELADDLIGKGSSRKIAEQNAAAAALERLDMENTIN